MARIKKLIPDYKFVQSATCCERMNRSIQANFFRILKNRQSKSIVDALAKAEVLCNNTASKKHKKTPLEIVDDPSVSNETILKQHNKSRKSFVKGDNRSDFKVGDWVRVLAPEKVRRGLDYKTYKGVTYEKSVHKITKATKKAKVKKYRLDDRRWLTQDRLLKASPIDKKSQQLIKDRDEVEKKKLAAHRKDVRDYAAAQAVVKADEIRTGTGRRVTRRSAAVKGLKKLEEQRKKAEKQDLEIEEDQALFKREQAAKNKDRNVTRANAKIVTEFKKLAEWVKGEQDKTYDDKPNADQLTDTYNLKIDRGKDIAKLLRKQKVRLDGISINYFNRFSY